MNFTLTFLDNVTKICEKWNTLFMIENGHSTRALFLVSFLESFIKKVCYAVPWPLYE